MSVLSSKTSAQLSSKIGDQINLENVIIIPYFDNDTLAKDNALRSLFAQSRIAAQAINHGQKKARSQQGTVSICVERPDVLVRKCLDIVEGGKAKLPDGFTCWPSA